MRTGSVVLFVFSLVILSVVGVAFVGIIAGVGLGEIVNPAFVVRLVNKILSKMVYVDLLLRIKWT